MSEVFSNLFLLFQFGGNKMIITDKIKLKWNRRNIGHYTSKGYFYTNLNDEFIISANDLHKCCRDKIEVMCDNEDCDNRIIKEIQYSNYIQYYEGNNGKYYCRKCANILKGCPNRLKNQRDRGDNFGEFLLDEYGKDAINKYWSDLNSKTAFDFTPSSNEKVFLKCPNNPKHPDYKVGCNSFKSGQKCPYCSHNRVTKEDSLGSYLKDINLLRLYSNENEKSAFEYGIKSNKKVKWKCHNDTHEDYERCISNANKYYYSCPKCRMSSGEARVYNYLNINNIKFEQQIKYDNLLGVNGGKLSYDFYLKDYNTLIEFQGEQHRKFMSGFHNNVSDFEKQQEHDRRKKEYAEKNKIKLLEIWYRDFDKIEDILNNLLEREVMYE